MRIVSWTVIIGAVTALFQGTIRPLVPDFSLPTVDASMAVGTVAESKNEAGKTCPSGDMEAPKEGHATPLDCDEVQLVQD